ncbi:penicillin acylase family protein [Streptomyces sp. NBC_00233]|uniref:penicillin acylase family protein n=1 Tax=Streptomyces sp. NBC_00233 TaxID=2975686 RepID=UPI00224E7434|nr:penicillin acylase family protein [Streptomyces sp. NBC_00233]MCX5225427.1 penicillin acylase family protein [Streptomyces sp. NBC_00233]
MDGIGVSVSIEVYRDAWGVPHLRAADQDELAFAQGRVTARDRAWQLEVERHRAQGTTAAFLGAAELGWDTFARRSRLADTARRCFERLEREDARTAAWVRAYVDGVNAGLPEGAARAPEFAETGLTPGRWEPWTPLAVWLTTHILFAGFPTKLWREEVARRLGEEWTELFATDGPGTSGSNGWLVAGGRTASGSALVAGDPHRFIEAPGVYQQIRLACPAYDVVGIAVPGIPGLAHFGHTGPVAWAITNAMSDYQDLYRERLRRLPDGGVEAYGPEGWRPATTHTETIEVAGGEPVVVEVIETDRGPVIIGVDDEPGDVASKGAAKDGVSPDQVSQDRASQDRASQDRASVWEGVALRYPPRVTGQLGFEVLPALLRARTVADVDTALDGWVEPVNVVLAADTEGGLLHRVAGRVPVRHRTNSLRIVPAWDPKHAWEDDPAPLPRAEVDGHAVMANARGLAAPLGVEFAPPHRADRIDALLGASADWTPESITAVHRDTDSRSAARLLAAVERVGGNEQAGSGPSSAAPSPAGLSPAASAVRDRLLAWDRRMDAESTDAGLYAAVRGAVVRRFAAHEAFTALREPAPYPEVFRPWLALGPRVAYALETLLVAGPVPAADVDRIVREALDEVAAGEPPAAWGVTHRLAPWQALPDPDDAQWPGLGGDHDCVLSTSSVPGWTDRSARASAARYVWDLADRERSGWIVPFGASGVPGDPHHRDQLPLWLRGGLAPVTTDWQNLTKEQG